MSFQTTCPAYCRWQKLFRDGCGIEGAGNISYAARGLELAYAVRAAESGTYTISYNYVSNNDTTLGTKVDGENAAESQMIKYAGEGNWYEGDYQDSECRAYLLQNLPLLLARPYM